MLAKRPIKVLVVDDSSLMRTHICNVLSENGMVTDIAANGQECIDKIQSFGPDVITLDINMPVMDGIECLRQIMAKHPLPVVMVSSLTQENANETLSALEIGAVDYVAKPSGSISLSLNRDKYMLASKVINASKIKVRAKPSPFGRLENDIPKKLETRLPRAYAKQTHSNFDLVIIGVSTGGPNALQEIIPALPDDFPIPIVIAQHMPARFTAVFAERLNKLSALQVVELNDAQVLHAGTVYIAQGDANIEVYKQGNRLAARPDLKECAHIWRPSITNLVQSALNIMPVKRLCCVQLTGMGNDGAHEMATAHKQGATTIAESEKTAVVYGMPKELVKLNGASMVLPNSEIAKALLSLR